MQLWKWSPGIYSEATIIKEIFFLTEKIMNSDSITDKQQYLPLIILQVTGLTYLKDNISQIIRMQNKQMIICEEISAPPVCPTDIFATRMDTSTSS